MPHQSRGGAIARWMWPSTGSALESVDLNMILLESVFTHLGFIFVGKEVHHFGTMVTLELNHFTHVGIDDDGAIACYW
jgi:hypothetical protein